MDPATATTVLLVLGSAFGVMFATMTTLLVVSIRVQHREGQETREYVARYVEKAVGNAMGALRLESNERLDSRFNELMQVIEHNRGTLGDAMGTLGNAMGALRLEFNERLDSRFNELMQVIEHNRGTLGDAMGTLGNAMGALRLEFNERLDSRFNELMQVIEHNHQISELQHKATQKRLDRLEAGVAETRERLARIEGHLGIGPHQPADPAESDSDAA